MALYLRKKLDNKAEIAVWQVTETEEELMNLVSVPTDEMEEISLFRNESHRRQKLAVRALINEVFEEKMYLNHHDNGKPYLENCATNISITHTDKYVAIIIHDDEEVGIDIESLDRDFAVVEKKALSEDEIEDLEDEKKNEQLDKKLKENDLLREQIEELHQKELHVLEELSGISADEAKAKLEGILRNTTIFGVDLIEVGLGDLVCQYFVELIAGKGAVRATLKKYLAEA